MTGDTLWHSPVMSANAAARHNQVGMRPDADLRSPSPPPHLPLTSP
jgi:hypothetical protein